VVTSNSGIAEKVVEPMARTRSVDSGEITPDAGMFADSVDVLNWLGDDFLPPVTADSSGRVATESGSDEENRTLSDTMLKMRDFLSDNATFDWLNQRVQAIMSTSGGGDVSAVSKKLLGILKKGFSAADGASFKYSIDWDPQEFMQCNYAGYVDIASVMGINSDGHVYEACTVGGYITRVWPVTGPRFLEVLRSWWIHISHGREEEPIRRMLACLPYSTLD
jgi:hypothetical protein